MSRRDDFQRQVQTLVDNDYPSLAGLSVEDFVGLTAPLEKRLDDVPPPSHDRGLAFAIVVASALVPTWSAMERVVDGKGERGVVDMTPVEPGDFEPRPGTELPAGPIYLIADVDTGKETLNVPPRDALRLIEAQGRLPLTIDEGVAVLTQFPDVLRTHNAFQLLASRRDDKRIPSIWTSYRQPRLGWCWEGNPHSWLGSASAAARLG
ncbi:MAG: DUF5701 family protein [Nocardioidaceae bacterium]